MIAPEKPMPVAQLHGERPSITVSNVIQNRALRQFVKFCLVGASSTVVNLTVLNLMYYTAHLNLPGSVTAAFLISVCNGFIWNRRWTFKESRGHSARKQYPKFLLVNTIAWLLDMSIITVIIVHFAHPGQGLLQDPGQFAHMLKSIVSGEAKQQYSPALLNGAQLGAISVVVFWNFFANRLWTFKH
jgi:putative flippase GtrA